MKPLENFLIVVLDEDRKLFTIVGPMSDETEWNRRVSSAQAQGRRVFINGPLHKALTKEELIAETRKRLGYAYLDESIV